MTHSWQRTASPHHQDNLPSTLLCYLIMLELHFLHRMRTSYLMSLPPDCPMIALLLAG